MKAIIMEIAEFIRDVNPKRLNSAWVKFYVDDEFIGEVDARAALCALLDEQRIIDLHKPEWGGSAPVDITSITKIEIYTG